MEENKFVLIKCAKCGKVLKSPDNSVSVYCLMCKEWTSIIHDKNKDEEKQ